MAHLLPILPGAAEYYLDVDGVLLLGNNFNAKLFGRVGGAGFSG